MQSGENKAVRHVFTIPILVEGLRFMASKCGQKQLMLNVLHDQSGVMGLVAALGFRPLRA